MPKIVAEETNRPDAPDLSAAEEQFLRAIRTRLSARRLKPPPTEEQEKIAVAVLQNRSVTLSHEEAGRVLEVLHRDWSRRLWADVDADRAEAEREFTRMLSEGGGGGGGGGGGSGG